jgi:hypothetical protein
MRKLRWLGALAGLLTIFCVALPGGSAAAIDPADAPYTWPGAALLHVVNAPNGAGWVQSSPFLIDCPVYCTMPVDKGTTLTLTAHPSEFFEFAGWLGGGCGSDPSCTVKITGDTEITALYTFTNPTPDTSGEAPPGTFRLDVGLVEIGGTTSGGTAYDLSGQINCPARSCSAFLPDETPPYEDVVIFYGEPNYATIPIADVGCDGFTGPVGATSDGEIYAYCVVFMSGHRSVTGVFAPF